MQEFPRLRMQKISCMLLARNIQSFQKNEKNEPYDNHWVNVCFESNIVDLSSDTWWLNSGVTIHACNSMQVVISRRSPTSLEQYVYMGDGTRVQIDILGVFRLQLSTENILELRDVAYIPSIRRILISIPILDRLGYSFFFLTGKVNLYQDFLLIGNETLCGDLYRLGLYSLLLFFFSLNVYTVSNTKSLKLNEKFSILGTSTGSYFQTKNIYLEDDTGTSQGPREIVFKEHRFFILVPIDSALISSLIVGQHPVATTDDEPIEDVDPVARDVNLVTLDVFMDIPLRRSERVCKPAISNDYIVHLQEHEYNVGDVSDQTTYKEAIISPHFNFWIDAMKDEMISM